MGRPCIVKGCRYTKCANYQPKDIGVVIHSIPTQEDTRNLWFDSLGRNNLRITVSGGICSNHFKFEDYLDWDVPDGRIKRRLLPSAIPKLSLRDLENINVGNTQDTISDHTEEANIGPEVPEPEYDSDASTNFEENSDNEDITLEQIRAEKRATEARNSLSQAFTQSNADAVNIATEVAASFNVVLLPPNRISIPRGQHEEITGEEHANMIAESIKQILVLSRNEEFRRQIFDMLDVTNSYDAEKVIQTKVLKLLGLPLNTPHQTLETFFLARESQSQSQSQVQNEGDESDSDDAMSISLLEYDEDIASISLLDQDEVCLPMPMHEPAAEDDANSVSLLQQNEDEDAMSLSLLDQYEEAAPVSPLNRNEVDMSMPLLEHYQCDLPVFLHEKDEDSMSVSLLEQEEDGLSMPLLDEHDGAASTQSETQASQTGVEQSRETVVSTTASSELGTQPSQVSIENKVESMSQATSAAQPETQSSQAVVEQTQETMLPAETTQQGTELSQASIEQIRAERYRFYLARARESTRAAVLSGFQPSQGRFGSIGQQSQSQPRSLSPLKMSKEEILAILTSRRDLEIKRRKMQDAAEH